MDNNCSTIIGTTGFVAIFAVSGSVVFLAMQAHKRLLSNIMKKFEIKKPATGTTVQCEHEQKKVRIIGDEMAGQRADHVGGKGYIPRPAKYSTTGNHSMSENECLEGMPQNWQVTYKGILQYRTLRGYS